MSSLPSKHHTFLGVGSPTADLKGPLLGPRHATTRSERIDSGENDWGIAPPTLDWNEGANRGVGMQASTPCSPRMQRLLQSPRMQSPSNSSSRMDSQLCACTLVGALIPSAPKQIFALKAQRQLFSV